MKNELNEYAMWITRNGQEFYFHTCVAAPTIEEAKKNAKHIFKSTGYSCEKRFGWSVEPIGDDGACLFGKRTGRHIDTSPALSID